MSINLCKIEKSLNDINNQNLIGKKVNNQVNNIFNSFDTRNTKEIFLN